MKKNSVSEFELERQDFKIRLKRSGNGGHGVGEDAPLPAYVPPVVAVPATALAAPALHAGTVPAAPSAPPSNTASAELDIKSPMIGTFYRAPSPESANYVEVGAEVNPETVVCIIEAMKVMNEIKAEIRGVITEILVENAKPVEFGQPLFKVKPL